MDSLRHACIAFSLEQLRNARDGTTIDLHYRVIRLNVTHFTCASIVHILQNLHTKVYVYDRSHLMAVRRCVEYDGIVPHEGRVSAVFDATKHVLYVAEPSHLDHVVSGSVSLLQPTIRRGRCSGVVVWWS